MWVNCYDIKHWSLFAFVTFIFYLLLIIFYFITKNWVFLNACVFLWVWKFCLNIMHFRFSIECLHIIIFVIDRWLLAVSRLGLCYCRIDLATIGMFCQKKRLRGIQKRLLQRVKQTIRTHLGCQSLESCELFLLMWPSLFVGLDKTRCKYLTCNCHLFIHFIHSLCSVVCVVWHVIIKN